MNRGSERQLISLFTPHVLFNNQSKDAHDYIKIAAISIILCLLSHGRWVDIMVCGMKEVAKHRPDVVREAELSWLPVFMPIA